MLIIFSLLLFLYFLSFLLSLNNRNLDKLLPYECGLEPIGTARGEFQIIYYIIGLLYLIFDLEILFLYPFAASLWLLNSYLGFISVLLFFIFLTIGFIYEWLNGTITL
jgi:NADH-quinone oxidoreductase subunit A